MQTLKKKGLGRKVQNMMLLNDFENVLILKIFIFV